MYKKAGNGVITGGTYIAPGGTGWDLYQLFILQGGQPAKEFTAEELLERKRIEIDEELKIRISSIGFSDQKGKNRSLARGLRLIKKKIDGQASGAELDELDVISSKADQTELLSEFADAEKESIGLIGYDELEQYEPKTAEWPF